MAPKLAALLLLISTAVLSSRAEQCSPPTAKDDAQDSACAANSEDRIGLLQVHQPVPQPQMASDKPKPPTFTPEPNPPTWGPQVIISGTQDFQQRLNTTYANQHLDSDGEFSFGADSYQRWAVFILPGTHQLDIDVPYYMSVYGLGDYPQQTTVNPGPRGVGLRVNSDGFSKPQPGSLNTFWRSIENLHLTQPIFKFWVSQAAPLRAMKIEGSLQLGGGGYSSGGTLLNSEIMGNIDLGSQQQWFTRSTKMMKYPRNTGIGSYVCAGCVDKNGQNFRSTEQSTTSDHTGLSYTDAPPIMAEKPYIVYRRLGGYFLKIPGYSKNLWGPTRGGEELDDFVPFQYVFVATGTRDGVGSTSAAEINKKIASGKHVVFQPGVYLLEEPIVVAKPSITLLGLGYATLIGAWAMPLIRVDNVPGVRIAGLMLEAGCRDPTEPMRGAALLQWGTKPSRVGLRRPGVMSDLCVRAVGFCRGINPSPQNQFSAVERFIEINNDHVLGDNVWLWNADHCGMNNLWPCVNSRAFNGLMVNGNDVTIYGLMAEHTHGDIVTWNGERGRVVFLQVEFRYSRGLKSLVLSPDAHTAYRVNAESHTAVGGGIYVVVNPADTKSLAGNQFSPLVEPLTIPGGLTAVFLQHKGVKAGFKDFHALNFDSNKQWPPDESLTCKFSTCKEPSPGCGENISLQDGTELCLDRMVDHIR